MTPTLIDADGRSSIAAAEAQAALGLGDTPRAQERYAVAGRSLEGDASRAQTEEDKHLALFLAATQYYKGGHYQRAHLLGQEVQTQWLPATVQPLLQKFRRDAKERALPEYQEGVCRKLLDHWKRKEHGLMLEVLQEHPYVLPAGWMAFVRAVACESMGKHQAAAIFYADALCRMPSNPDLVFTAAAFPLTLPRQGKLQEAWESVRHLLERFPHPITYAIASLVCFHRAEAETGTGRNTLIEQQAALFNQALAAYEALPESQRQFPETRAVLSLGFVAVAFALLRLGAAARARTMSDAAIQFEPHNPSFWTVRGIVTYPEPAAVADLTKAVDLGDESLFPYYYLAHHALSEDDFRSGLSWTEEAIKRGQKQNNSVKSQLYGWLAICQASLSAAREDVEAIFQTALEIDPTNHEVQHNLHRFVFVNSVERATVTRSGWEKGAFGGMESLLLSDQEARLLESFRDAAVFRSKLKPGGQRPVEQDAGFRWVPINGDRLRPLFLQAKVANFKVTWAGSSPLGDGFCFGSADGRLLFTDEEGRRLHGPDKASVSREAINGVARQGSWIGTTTRREINLWPLPGAEGGNEFGIVLPHGAHGILATASGHFVGPLGKMGLLMARPGPGLCPVVLSNDSEGSPYFYRVINLAAASAQEVLACAIRRGGLGVMEFSGAEANHTLSTVSFSGIDVVDVCALSPGTESLAAAALGSDGTLVLFRDVLRDKTPVTIKFGTVKGVACRLLSCRGHLFLLTSNGMYVLAKLAGRFVQGEELSDAVATPILFLSMEAVDANLCGDRWLLVVMPDEVRRYDVGLIHESTPRSITHGHVQQFEFGEIREILHRRRFPEVKRDKTETRSRPLFPEVEASTSFAVSSIGWGVG